MGCETYCCLKICVDIATIKRFFYPEMAGLICDLKKFEEFSWLKAFDSAASQQVARELDVALKHSFTKGRL
ncbi:MAG: putative transposase [Cognaticolwellia sp.]